MNAAGSSDTRPLRLAVIDDETLVREGLTSLFRTILDVECTLAVGDLLTALRHAECAPPDVALVDLTTRNLGLKRNLRLWMKQLPQVRLLLFDDRVRKANLLLAQSLPAAGYVTKSDRFADILAAIRLVAQGGSRFPDAALGKECAASNGRLPHGPHVAASREPLTPRETEVLKLLAHGFSVERCAAELGVSPGTVDDHKSRIMKKLGVHKVVELARWAIREGLIRD